MASAGDRPQCGERSVAIGAAPALQQRGRRLWPRCKPRETICAATPGAGLSPGLGLRHLVEELAAFEDHKPCATPLTCDLRTDLPAAGGDQGSSVVGRRSLCYKPFSCTQKYWASMCFVRDPSPNRSVKELRRGIVTSDFNFHLNSHIRTNKFQGCCCFSCSCLLLLLLLVLLLLLCALVAAPAYVPVLDGNVTGCNCTQCQESVG